MFVSEFAKYISRMEGFTQVGSPAWRNNNPGNLDAGPREDGKDPHGYAVYERISSGWQDLEDLIESTIRKHPSLTCATFFAGQRDSNGSVIAGGYSGYSPAKDPRGSNSPADYASFVASGLGISATEILIDRLDEDKE